MIYDQLVSKFKLIFNLLMKVLTSCAPYFFAESRRESIIGGNSKAS